MNRRQLFTAAALGFTGGLATVDIASLFSPRPSRPSQDVRYRSGTIVSFDPNTLENVVNVGGTDLTDLPLLGVGEATLLTAGSVVGILVIGDENHGKTYAIIGRLVSPNTPAAEDAIGLLNSQIKAAVVATAESTTSTVNYVDLTTVGPSVTVNVGPSGRVAIIATAAVFSSASNVTNAGFGGLTDVALSGANTSNPDSATILGGLSRLTKSQSAQYTLQFSNSITAAIVLEGLNSGNTTFKLMYRAASSTSGATFSNRTLTVIKL